MKKGVFTLTDVDPQAVLVLQYIGYETRNFR